MGQDALTLKSSQASMFTGRFFTSMGALPLKPHIIF